MIMVPVIDLELDRIVENLWQPCRSFGYLCAEKFENDNLDYIPFFPLKAYSKHENHTLSSLVRK